MAITNSYGVPETPIATASAVTLASVGPVAGALFAATGPVGGVLASVAAVLGALGVNIQGTTSHFSFQQALQNLAIPQTNKLWPLFQKAYSTQGLQVIAAKVAPRFLNAMQNYWGLGTSQNQAIAQNISQNVAVNDALNNQLVMFFVWIGTNIDTARAQDELLHIVPIYFSAIFEGAISDAGIDPATLVGGQEVINEITGPNPGAGSAVTVPAPTVAGVFGMNYSSLVFIGIVIGGLFLVSKKKG